MSKKIFLIIFLSTCTIAYGEEAKKTPVVAGETGFLFSLELGLESGFVTAKPASSFGQYTAGAYDNNYFNSHHYVHRLNDLVMSKAGMIGFSGSVHAGYDLKVPSTPFAFGLFTGGGVGLQKLI